MNEPSSPSSAALPVRFNQIKLPERAGELFVAMAIYIGAVLLANQTTIIFLELPWYGLVSVGTLVFGITFTQRDRVHRAGRFWVYLMLVITTILASIQSYFLDVSWRIIVASTLAILLAETADTEVFQRLRDRRWIVRVIGSNAVSVPLDSVIFTVVAFAGVFSWGMIWSIVWGDIVAKTVVATFAAFFRSRESRP